MEQYAEKQVSRRRLFGTLLAELGNLVLPAADADTVLRYVRPPGALEEKALITACSRCGECINTCPRGALAALPPEEGLAMGTPYLDLRQNPCDLCLECTRVCPTGALRVVNREEARLGLARIDRGRCLGWQGTLCQACKEACPEKGTISLMDASRPRIDSMRCTGCGFCIEACLADPPAIKLTTGSSVSVPTTQVGKEVGKVD